MLYKAYVVKYAVGERNKCIIDILEMFKYLIWCVFLMSSISHIEKLQ